MTEQGLTISKNPEGNRDRLKELAELIDLDKPYFIIYTAMLKDHTEPSMDILFGKWIPTREAVLEGVNNFYDYVDKVKKNGN